MVVLETLSEVVFSEMSTSLKPGSEGLNETPINH